MMVALVAAGCSTKSTPPSAGSQAPSSTNGPTAGTSSSSSVRSVPSQRAAPVESNPPGDIPDNIAYVPYRNAAAGYTFVHPEGWASVVHGATVTFTDKLNGVTASGFAATAAPTVVSSGQDVARLRATQPAFELRTVKSTSLPGGTGVLIVFRRNSVPDPVTGKVFRDEVERYEIYLVGREVVLDLYGAVGSDNVDPYTKISQSLRLS